MENTDGTKNCVLGEDKAKPLTKLMHACADEICGYPGPKFEHYKDDTGWNESDYIFIYTLFTNLLKNPASLYLEKEKMPAEYHEFPEFLKVLIMTCLKVRQEQLVDVILRNIAKNDSPTVSNFDWKVKYVLESNKKASINEPLLQLHFLLDDKKTENTLSIEMNESELNLLIKTLESVK